MPKKILLADDSITIQKVVELTFSEGDYQVTSVGNGAEALNLISKLQPDVALLDVIMPEVNGYEVCEKIRQNPATSAIPVLLLTGTFEPFDRKRAESAGANGHLTKPFESQMLITRVDELIAAVVPKGKEENPEAILEHQPASEEPTLPEYGTAESDPNPYEDRTEERGKPNSAGAPSSDFEGFRAVGTSPLRDQSSPTGSMVDSERQGIIPDRFEDQTSRQPLEAATSIREGRDAVDEGVRTIRLSTDEAMPEAPVPIETDASDAPGTDRGAEAWDELASGLAAAPPADPETDAATTHPSVMGSEASLMGDGLVSKSNRNLPERAAHGSVPEPTEDAESPLPPVMNVSPSPKPLSSLSDTDVERIAAKVVEQMADSVIREIAWEVIPELAETLIKQRIRELEEKISREG